MYGYKENLFKLQEVDIVKTALNDYNIVKLENNRLNKQKSKLLEI